MPEKKRCLALTYDFGGELVPEPGSITARSSGSRLWPLEGWVEAAKSHPLKKVPGTHLNKLNSFGYNHQSNGRNDPRKRCLALTYDSKQQRGT